MTASCGAPMNSRAWPLASRGLLLEEIVERGASVVRPADILRQRRTHTASAAIRSSRGGRLALLSGDIPGDRDAWAEQFALIRLVLHRDARRNRLQALEPRGRLEMRALLAAMQRRGAFRTGRFEVGSNRQRRRAIETARSGDGLYQSGKARTCDINRWPRALRLGPVLSGTVSISVRAAVAIGLLIAALFIFTITVHGCEARSLEDFPLDLEPAHFPGYTSG